jgi:hypothetical protein
MPRVQRTFKVQFDKGESREEILLGRQYLVVPVIAMVEGVRFGANQTEPELGLASEFGNNSIIWANRPLVLNHPQVDGDFVSANTPEILEQYQFGLTMNPQIKGSKLHMEAWIDVARVKELGGDFQDTYDRVVAQEDVEVSVGFFSDLEKKKGKFKGQPYGAIWRNIKPDHLAILSEGIRGACSVEDGCGVPRINEVDMAKTPQVTTSKSSQCSCGGTHTQEEHQNQQSSTPPEDDSAPVTQGAFRRFLEALKPITQSEEERVTEAHKADRERNHQLLAHTINTDLMDNDVRKILSQEGSKKFPKYAYLYGYNQDVAVYERYNDTIGGYELFQISFNLNGAKVEFVGEPEQVILQTKIVPLDKVKLTTETTQENDMTTPTTQATNPTPTTPPNPAPNPTPTPSNPPTPTSITQSAPTTQEPTPKVLSAEEYISQAPAEVREVLQSSLKLHATQKTAAIKALTDHKSNRFSKEYLEAQPLEVLENMVALLPGTYQGVAPATQTRFQSGNSNGETVPVVKAFERKTNAAA